VGTDVTSSDPGVFSRFFLTRLMSAPHPRLPQIRLQNPPLVVFWPYHVTITSGVEGCARVDCVVCQLFDYQRLSDLHMGARSLISRNAIAGIGGVFRQTTAIMSRYNLRSNCRSSSGDTEGDAKQTRTGLSDSESSSSEQSADSRTAPTGPESRVTADTEQDMPYIVGHDRKRQEFYIKLQEGRYDEG
jgi:hypothetical protein